MSISEFRKLSRQNNYTVSISAGLLPKGSNGSLIDILKAGNNKIMYIKRNHKVVALIPLAKKHNVADFTSNNPDVTKPEMNLIKEFTTVKA